MQRYSGDGDYHVLIAGARHAIRFYSGRCDIFRVFVARIAEARYGACTFSTGVDSAMAETSMITSTLHLVARPSLNRPEGPA